MSPRVLIVEDERDIADLMSLHLKREGHDVTTVENGEDALRMLSGAGPARDYQLLVLDWMLPGLSGLELCKKIRGEKAADSAAMGCATSAAGVPILMVTARAHTSDIVLGLEMGADDYITKPFEIPIFLARVRALLRRSAGGEEEQTRHFELGALSIDLESYKVSCQGKELQLTPSEFKLLVALIRSQGRVLTRERLIDMVQGEGVTVVDRAIDTHIFGLRKKLGRCADLVETIRGVGYRIRTDIH